jgi:hypothetical protein
VGEAAAAGGAGAGASFEVLFCRKAQCLAADLADRFKGEGEGQFQWADCQQLTADTSKCLVQGLGL